MNEILKTLEKSKDFHNGVSILLKFKPEDKSIYKSVEELGELLTVLLQYNNKLTNKPEVEDILEEIIDVQMHLILLYEMIVLYGAEKTGITSSSVVYLVNRKIAKMLDSRDFFQYKKMNDENKSVITNEEDGLHRY